jgi:biopolymer transport protein TolQ
MRAEMNHLESQVSHLATIGSTSPFVGLFGTVWGIMVAFTQISPDAEMQAVAQPISEALIVTALGLFAAIPAVIGYNYFTGRLQEMGTEMDNFSSDFLNIVKRHFFE